MHWSDFNPNVSQLSMLSMYFGPFLPKVKYISIRHAYKKNMYPMYVNWGKLKFMSNCVDLIKSQAKPWLAPWLAPFFNRYSHLGEWLDNFCSPRNRFVVCAGRIDSSEAEKAPVEPESGVASLPHQILGRVEF